MEARKYVTRKRGILVQQEQEPKMQPVLWYLITIMFQAIIKMEKQKY